MINQITYPRDTIQIKKKDPLKLLLVIQKKSIIFILRYQ